jgi:hypothetical protein
MRQPAASYESLEGQEKRIRSQISANFQLDGAHCCAGKQRNVTLSQGDPSLDVEGSSEIYAVNLKRSGGNESIGGHRSLPLLPEGVPRDFTREARVQKLLNRLPGPQYPKFLPQFRKHDADSQVMQPNVRFHDQQSRKMVRPMEENRVHPLSRQVSKLKTAAIA